MKGTIVTIEELLSPLKQYFLKDTFIRSDINDAPPLRAGLFTLEQFSAHASDLAGIHEITSKRTHEHLLKRLAENEQVLLRVIDLLQEAVRNKTPVSPAGEWLLDNFYLIEEQIQIGKKHLPKGYSKGLPKLSSTSGSLPGLPRVYDIAIEIISHSDGHLDIHILNRFIQAYQQVTELTLGELWAIPIMLRLALLENLRRVAARIAIDRIDANSAHHWADRIIKTAEKNPRNLVLTMADMARSNPPIVSAFIAEYSRMLQWKGVNLALPLSWMEQHLSETGDTINGMVLSENQKQAADHVIMSNSIKSLRFLAKTDWRKFVEAISIVEQTLRSEVDGVYPTMDFYTRDQYRHAVERISINTRLPENEVAKTVVRLATECGVSNTADKRTSHVGYFLIGDGLKHIEKLLKSRSTVREFLRKIFSDYAPTLYTAGTLILAALITYGLMHYGVAGNTGKGLTYLMAILSLLAASQLAMAIINWVATLRAGPIPLPKMDFSKSIPEDARTLVVIPTMLTSIDQIEKLVEALEVRFLGNRDPNLLFGLLTDFKDAKKEFMPDDEVLVATASGKISELNIKYCQGSSGLFFLFHRPRLWNAADKEWIGYERKRGKLGALNGLLRGGSKECFTTIVGDEKSYSSVRYVITLDTDTQLPREAACRLIGVMAHPLNRPIYDEKKKRIVKGYGIIQPRIAVSLHGAVRSRYTRLHENDAGIDPYTRVTSDVYQDIFGEGSFIGKGIYDVDAFEKVLGHRFPINRILSHDLLEGNYVRSGFASDIQLYEEYPTRYSIDISRRHRWIRGDWQIGNWFLPWVPGVDGKLIRNPLSALSKWKILDNLRRSIIPIVLLLLLLLGWTLVAAPIFWTLSVLAIVTLPMLSVSGWHLVKKPKEISFSHHLENVFENAAKGMTQASFQIVCLPYEAFVNADAILKTLWRMIVTHRHMLEWSPSGSLPESKETLFTTIRRMLFPPLASALLLYILSRYFPLAVGSGSPLLALWIASPLIVYWVGLPHQAFKSTITVHQKIYLRELARKTWGFFESQVSLAENWLPPDNIQQYPVARTAHRTSPTNMGVALLSNLAAYDLGYVTGSQLLSRTSKTFGTLQKLERYAGHFFNWYDTQSLSPLHPRYISTVDSGNLAGHLITLQQGLLDLPHQQIIKENLWEGLRDTVGVICQYVSQHVSVAGKTACTALREDFLVTHPPKGFSLKEVSEKLKNCRESLNRFIQEANIKDTDDSMEWIASLQQQLDGWEEEMTLVAPWMQYEERPERFKNLSLLSDAPTLIELAGVEGELIPKLIPHHSPDNSENELHWLTNFEKSLVLAGSLAHDRISEIQRLSAQCVEFANMEYAFLYDPTQHLMSIGYNADDHRLDTSYYDLLASEARLGLFIAIAQGKIPQESWFALGRRLTQADSTSVLLSWSGSMFEYLMPNLIMPTYENTLLDETCKGAVKKQINYGKQHGVPWGISESCYNMVDANLTYQYRAFGIPELGFKRGLGVDLVVAPYATVMALMIDPAAACKNLERLRSKAYEGKYGFFESVDYSPARLTRSKVPALIQSFMAHHQGMSLLSLDYLLCQQPMQKRFEADPNFQTALLLLQERVPATTGYYTTPNDYEEVIHTAIAGEMRVIKTYNSRHPEIQLLSNGKYHVMISNAGGGYSRYNDLAITRWREDANLDNWGAFCYVRDLETGAYWSNTFQPTLKEPLSHEAIFSQGRVEFRRVDNGIELHTEIIVSPEDNVEIRRLHITNNSRGSRKIEITSYAEVVLALPADDDSHPAFSNLFVQTEINFIQQCILCTRRPRSKEELPPWAFHLTKISGVKADHVSYETDRYRFIGRGNSIVNPDSMHQAGPLSNTQGPVLDPIVSIQYRITLPPEKTAIIDFVTGIAEAREGCQNLIDKYQDRSFRNRAFELTWTHSQVVLRQINVSESEAELFSQMASSILYSNPDMRAPQDVLIRNTRGQSALWSYSLSGDLPIVLLQVSDATNITLIKQLMQARSYWLFKGLVIDLVIINEDHSGYRQVLQEQVQSLIAAGVGIHTTERQGNIVVRLADQISNEDKVLLQTVARVIISDKNGTLFDQVNKKHHFTPTIPYLPKGKKYEPISQSKMPHEPLLFDNGIGGFSAHGDEYVITTREGHATPLPWSNVIANPNFGTIVTESGPLYTWSENAHEFRLTPWNNDSISNNSGEAFYIRDEESGDFWSPTPFPTKGKGEYVTRHGFGYSIFETTQDGISTQVWIYVDTEAKAKFTVIKVKNFSGRTRSLSATGYVEWVMGSLRPASLMHVVTEFDAELGALVTQNPFNTAFANRIAFMDVDAPTFNFTTDRNEFIGRNGTLEKPDGMKRLRLSGKQGAGMDPCSAIQTPFVLGHGKEREIIFRMGAAKDFQEGQKMMRGLSGKEGATNALKRVREFWSSTLGQTQIKTPDPSLNMLANGWLVYQVISCRLWGRTGFYQSGGAFGFRDQLQDVLAVMHAAPGLAREHILLSASRQFIEGDVQHWWHPPEGKGVRTLCSDDLLWLAYTTSRYVQHTDDLTILHEWVSFIDGRQLNADQESCYDLPVTTEEKSTLYDHCKRAITRSIRFGIHGLPLIGSGDWNDGMNNVGIEGKGESVWLGFFLFDVLKRFESVATTMKDEAFVLLCQKSAEQLKSNIDNNAWDGAWYRRAYFDDGSPLGSSTNSECKIDSIVQSWAVLSGAGVPAKTHQALESANDFLVDRTNSLIRILDPPFDHSEKDPGYIKGYLPGIRENGGQYSHAAIWLVMAMARQGNHQITWELLNMINPVNHGKSPDEIATYKAEPYVMAADVYSVSPHIGRGGWTWYTGSAGWMYQLILESFLGLTREGSTLKINPCVPDHWTSFEIDYRFENTPYHIKVLLTESDESLTLDGDVLKDLIIHLTDDHKDHIILMKLKHDRPMAESLIVDIFPHL